MTERTHYRVAEFATAIGVTERTVRRWIDKGEIDAVRIGSVVLIPVHVLVHTPNGVPVSSSDIGCQSESPKRRQKPRKAERNRHFLTSPVIS